MSAAQNSGGDKPNCPEDIGLRDIWRQFWRDIYDKETQSAATYSYMWIADQVGHIGVGMLLYLLLIAVDRLLGAQGGWLGDVEHRMLLYFGLAFAVMLGLELFKFTKTASHAGGPRPLWQRLPGVIRREGPKRADLLIFLYPLFLCYLLITGLEWSHPERTNVLVIALFVPAFWEYSSFKDALAKHNGLFQLKRRGLAFNALTATWYMWIGVLLGYGFDRGGGFALTMFVAMLFSAVIVAPWWLKQKIIWQKAALPYLSRLGTVDCPISRDAETAQGLADRIQHDFIDAICNGKSNGKPRQLVVCGPIQAGRTRLVAAIGTELCFEKQMVRYVSFDKLLEMIEFDDSDPGPQPVYSGPDNIEYWCWRDCQTLIIDDINSALLPTLEDNLETFARIARQQLTQTSSQALRDLAKFKECHSVWVIGEVDDPRRWVQFIAEICDSDSNLGPIVVELTALTENGDDQDTAVRNSAEVPL